MPGSHASENASPKPLTPVVFHTLLALASGPLHGYAISRMVDDATGGGVQMGPGTLYGSLQRMESAGFVTEADTVNGDASHEDRRRYYVLTAEGRIALEAEAMRLEHAVHLARAANVLSGG